MRVVVDDLAFLSSDAIVRPATARLDATTPAVRRLEQLGGEAFHARLVVQRELPVGAAVVTAGGGDLPAEFVIHAIIQSQTEAVSSHGVAQAWRAALKQAQEWEFAHVSAPPLGIGAGNLTLEDAAELMVTELAAHRMRFEFPTNVTLVVENDGDRDVFEAALRKGSASS